METKDIMVILGIIAGIVTVGSFLAFVIYPFFYVPPGPTPTPAPTLTPSPTPIPTPTLTPTPTPTPISRSKVAFRAHNGQYVCAEDGGGREVVANRDLLGNWETFEMINLGGNKVALKAHNGQYVCAEDGGGREVVANRDLLGNWETFEMIQLQ